MFRDASEELERLQAELLAEEEPEAPVEEEIEDEEVYEEYEEDTEPEEYENYATGYRAYNTDNSDEDLQAYSEDMRSGGKGRGGCCLTVIACVLMLILAGLLLWIAQAKGYLG